MVRSTLLCRHQFGASEWTNHDDWFRSRMIQEFGLDDNSAEKMSRFILSLFMSNEVDYRRERELFKYSKIGPNGRKQDFDSFDYVDGKSAFRVATEELSSVTESSDAAQLVRDLVAQIETGRRKRKASETQSIGSSRSSSSSSSYEEEFPTLGGSTAKTAPAETSQWLTPQLIRIEKSTRSRAKNSEKSEKPTNQKQFRFAFKNPKKKVDSPASTPSPPQTPTQKPAEGKTQPKKTKSKNGRPPDHQTPKKESDSKSKKRERNRKRKRPRKKKSPQKTDNDTSISPVPPLPRNQNLDSFSSLDDALVFLKNQSGSEEARDATIWRKVMEDQHVKYVNGSFFFSPRIKMPTQEKPDPLLDHAAKIAYRTISTIFDDESEDSLSRVQSTESLKSLSICDDKWPVKAVSNPVWTTDSW